LITTDKVYENKEWMRPYRENDRLGGFDPYSSSKAMSELAIDSYTKSFFLE
jgi:CDP-glucose 4,6-dehydratase